MRYLDYSKQFERDCKKNLKHLISTAWVEGVYKLLNDIALPEKYNDHPLKGIWIEHRDCHIKPDLVLIYKQQDNDLILVRLGSHSELGL